MTEIIHTLRSTGGDYSLASLHEDDIPLDSGITTGDFFTGETCLIFGHSGVTGSLSKGDLVTGGTSSAAGKILMPVTADKILIEVTSGTFQSGEQIYETADTNYITSSDAGSSTIVLVLEAYDDWTNGLVDVFTQASRVCDANNYLWFRAAPGEECTDADTGFRLLADANYTVPVRNTLAYSKVSSIGSIGTKTGFTGIRQDGPYSEVYNCAIYCSATSTNTEGIILADNTMMTYNNLIIGAYRGIQSVSGYSNIVCNNTIADCDIGVDAGTHSVQAVNTVVYGGTTRYTGTFDTTNSTNNHADNAESVTPPGQNPGTTNIASTDFVDAANDDYHLASGAYPIDQGANKTTLFTFDFDGDTRPSTGAWDAGADETVVTGITGTGSPQATTATSAGTGSRKVTGSGTPQATTATSSGTGTVGAVITGSGSPQAETATSSSVGLRVITGAGNPQALTATTSGVGSVGGVIVGTGSPQADRATSTGTGLRIVTGTGSPQANTATSSGVGSVGGTITGEGSPQADTATSTGTGSRVITGLSSSQADTATSSGIGAVGNVVTGTGSPQAATATSSGTGLRLIKGTGGPQASTAISNAVVLRVITGSGSPQAETATSYGFQVNATIPDCKGFLVEPEDRTITVEPEDRTITVEPEDRGFKVLCG